MPSDMKDQLLMAIGYLSQETANGDHESLPANTSRSERGTIFEADAKVYGDRRFRVYGAAIDKERTEVAVAGISGCGDDALDVTRPAAAMLLAFPTPTAVMTSTAVLEYIPVASPAPAAFVAVPAVIPSSWTSFRAKGGPSTAGAILVHPDRARARPPIPMAHRAIFCMMADTWNAFAPNERRFSEP
jgi:hypothetical protein